MKCPIGKKFDKRKRRCVSKGGGLFRVGSKVKQKTKNPFGKDIKKKTGTVVERGKHPFLYYNVKFPKDKDIYEFHQGELTKAR